MIYWSHKMWWNSRFAIFTILKGLWILKISNWRIIESSLCRKCIWIFHISIIQTHVWLIKMWFSPGFYLEVNSILWDESSLQYLLQKHVLVMLIYFPCMKYSRLHFFYLSAGCMCRILMRNCWYSSQFCILSADCKIVFSEFKWNWTPWNNNALFS